MSEEKETQSREPMLASSSTTTEAKLSSLAPRDDEKLLENKTSISAVPASEEAPSNPSSKTPTPGMAAADGHEVESSSVSRIEIDKTNSNNASNKIAPSNGKTANHTGGKNAASSSSSNTMNHSFATTPLSPMHPHTMQHTYYYTTHNIPNSPATPSMNSGYESILGTSLAHNNAVSNMFLSQQYPVIPPLSPPTQAESDANNGSKGQYAAAIGHYGDDSNFSNSNMAHNLSMGGGGGGGIPPASPLFPGTIPIYGGSAEQMIPMDTNAAAFNGRSMMGVALSPNSPQLQYLGAPPPSPIISYGRMYTSSGLQGSPEHSWSERSFQQHQMYPPSAPTPSPHISAMQYQQSQSRRAASFDGNELLPPSALEDSGPTVYTASVPTFFSQQQPWGYNLTSPSSPYSQSVAPSPISSQTFQAHPSQMHHMRSSPRGRHGSKGGGETAIPAPQGHLYNPAATPGPPIQTSHHNKGPEGANLFIFHIPNHFTNLDMWQLFCHYGTLLSVRIMVEKETGRSRGFGFVSYDSPDAAALAIKELNGFAIGNKRLKVQHKQIRPGDRDQDHFKSPPLFPEGNDHDDVSGGYHGAAPQDISYSISPADQANDAVHEAGEGDGHEVVLDQPSPEGHDALNLDSIGDALPKVSE
mmetsp:Transcript_1201/g.2174  ORF Transcript_1201/g.2174 Transcript_1201/m.2174 type:complete len:641 (+) Transcript_1201:438-2360(+)